MILDGEEGAKVLVLSPAQNLGVGGRRWRRGEAVGRSQEEQMRRKREIREYQAQAQADCFPNLNPSLHQTNRKTSTLLILLLQLPQHTLPRHKITLIQLPVFLPLLLSLALPRLPDTAYRHGRVPRGPAAWGSPGTYDGTGTEASDFERNRRRRRAERAQAKVGRVIIVCHFKGLVFPRTGCECSVF